jgi:hypothetical protein
MADHGGVRKLLVTALLLTAIASVAGAQARSTVNLPPMPPGAWHATINVRIRGAAHTLVYDRGRVTAVGTSSYTVREPDGSSVTINVGPATVIKIDGQPGTLAQIRPLEQATDVSIDGGTAARVTVRIPPALAALWARQAARQARIAARQAKNGGG